MCGIGGFIHFNSGFNLDEISKYFVDGLIHRGPDYQGTWFSRENNMVLVHTRLSILDLSESANQPLRSADGNIVIVFNGEIYNYAEIKKELLKRNKYEWITDHSDTEVIIHAYEEWGIECLSKFRGMFAFGLWDKREKILYVVRDRFGIKPVYFISKPDHFGFSSELKPFFNIYKEKKLNNNAVIEYLTTRGSIAPNTMVENMYKLDKGHYIKVRINTEKKTIDKDIIKYYDLNENIPDITFHYNNQDEIIEDLEQQLITSIKYRWISDSPVCLFLSGGIDSSLITAISSKLFEEKIHAFTIGLPGNQLDETKNAKKVADMFDLDIHVLDFSENPFDFLDEWLYFNDDLLSDPAAFSIFFLSKEIRKKGFKVVLSGEGSDEIFAGYDSYNTFCRDIQKPPINSLFRSLYKIIYSGYPRRGLEKYFSYDSHNSIYNGAAKMQNILSLENLIYDNEPIRSYTKKLLYFRDQHSENSPLDYALHFDLEFRIPNDLLLRTDRATMASGVEGRVPFLDHKLVEYAMSIPFLFKTGINYDKTKSILKKLALKYFDHQFVYRPKQGFPIPVSKWLLDKKVISEFDRFINERRVSCLNYTYLRKIYQIHKSGKDDFGDRLFNVFLLEKYIRFWNIS